MEKTIKVNISDRYETTPIAQLVQIAESFKSTKIYLKTEDATVNCKSIMGIMSLVLTHGMTVTIAAEGEEEEAAVDALCDFIG